MVVAGARNAGRWAVHRCPVAIDSKRVGTAEAADVLPIVTSHYCIPNTSRWRRQKGKTNSSTASWEPRQMGGVKLAISRYAISEGRI